MGARDLVRRNRRHVAAGAAVATALAGLGAVGSAPAYAAELSPCVDPDNGRPQLLDVAYSPQSVDVGDAPRQVTLRMRLADVGGPGPATGVAAVEATVGPDQVRGRGARTVDLEDAGGGWWRGTFTVPVGSTPGEWRLERASVRDAAGNRLEDPDDLGHDFLAPYDDVTLAVTSTPDTEQPTVTSLELSKHRIDTRRRARRIEVRVGAVDDLAGVRSVHVGARGARGRSVATELTERDGDTFVGVLRFPRGYGRGGWRVRSLTVVDEVGNVRQHFRRSIDQFGDRRFRVVAPHDRTSPRVAWRTVRPKKVDIRRDTERVRIRARLRDAGTGVRGADAVLFGQGTEMRRVRGTARDGVWVGRIEVGPCARFETKRGSIRIVDRAGNWRFHDFTAKVALRRPDNEPPRPTHLVNRLGSEGPLTFRFSEAVDGVHDDSIVVQATNWPEPLGAAVAGSWTCRRGNGEDTSCVDGRVREVTWVPDAPLTETSYRVTVNPDGVLDVTDRRGNPVGMDRDESDDYFEFRVVS